MAWKRWMAAVALGATLATVTGPVGTGPAAATDAARVGTHHDDGGDHTHGRGNRHERLAIEVTKAPVAPDGTTAGAVTDLVVGFGPSDPDVPGLGLKAGATISVRLPPQVVDQGTHPVADFATPGCAPPLVEGCNTALVLQGWPQSPIPPFPTVAWDPATSTITATMKADWLPAGPDAPGPKQIHLLLLGFRNPERPGSYPIRVEIRPNPTDDRVLSGWGRLRVAGRTRPSVEVISTINGAPPPPFPNTVFQRIGLGTQPLTNGWYLWDADGVPLTGAQLRMVTPTRGIVVDPDGKRVGRVRVQAPTGASGFELVPTGPAVERPAFITGAPTALLTANLRVDPTEPGVYRVSIRLRHGNRRTMTVEVRPGVTTTGE